MVVPIEYYCMQLFPVCLPINHFSNDVFDKSALEKSSALSHSVARKLTGNGMNVAAVGCVLAYALCSSRLGT